MGEVKIPREAQAILDIIPKNFVSDKCTKSLDSVFGYDFSFACVIHNFRYCGRCHDPVFMTYMNKLKADNELRQNISRSLPHWYLKSISWLYYAIVWKYGVYGSWNSCGLEVGNKCRHEMSIPKWKEKYRQKS